MGIGPGYRRNNPYTHSERSYNSMRDSLQAEINRLKQEIAKNPDPSNYEIISAFYSDGEYIALKVKYPNCTNAEGIKIMVIKSTPMEMLKRKSLDPHFGDDDSPIARFEPTDFGWDLAVDLVKKMKQPTRGGCNRAGL